jgi:hypothetical protein
MGIGHAKTDFFNHDRIREEESRMVDRISGKTNDNSERMTPADTGPTKTALKKTAREQREQAQARAQVEAQNPLLKIVSDAEKSGEQIKEIKKKWGIE